MEIRKRSLVIDGSNILSKYALSNKVILNSDSKDISAILYFLNYIMSIIIQYEASSVHLVFDIGRDVKKTKIFDKYKQNRIRVSNNVNSKFDEKQYTKYSNSRKLIVDLLNTTTIKCYPIPLIEGDTIIGLLALLEKKNGKDVFIVSEDGDLLQLIDENISMILPKKGDIRKHDEVAKIKDLVNIWNRFKVSISEPEKLKLKPKNIPYFKAIKGDTTDGIPNIPKLGDKFIEKLVNLSIFHDKEDFSTKAEFFDFLRFLLEEYKDVNDKGYKSFKKNLEKVFEYENLYDINLQLVDIYREIKDIPSRSLIIVMDSYEKEKVFNKSDFVRLSHAIDIDSEEDFSTLFTVFEHLEIGNFKGIESRLKNKWIYIQTLLSQLTYL